MTIQQALLRAIVRLRQAKTTSAHLDAEVLLASVLKKPRVFLHSHPEKKLTTNQARAFQSTVAKRINNHPVAYLTGNKEFYGLEFAVSPQVLVPRPDTETLVEEAIHIGRAMVKAQPAKKIIITDVGTGSGCIAATLAKYLPETKVLAIDISDKALSVAKKNAKRHKVLKHIAFLKGDLLSPLPKKMRCDLVCANLPYLTTNETKKLRHEPKLALHGGKLGLELLDRLIEQLPSRLSPGGMALLEIAPTQVKAVDYFVERSLPGKKVTFLKDLAGRDRVARIY